MAILSKKTQGVKYVLNLNNFEEKLYDFAEEFKEFE